MHFQYIFVKLPNSIADRSEVKRLGKYTKITFFLYKKYNRIFGNNSYNKYFCPTYWIRHIKFAVTNLPSHNLHL